MKFFIDHDYRYNLYLDDLPSATIMRDANNRELPPNYYAGIPIGFYQTDKITGEKRFALYNHLDITVIIHHTVEDHQRVVGFEVEPYSLKDEYPKERVIDPTLSNGTPEWLDFSHHSSQHTRFTYRTISRVSSILNSHYLD